VAPDKDLSKPGVLAEKRERYLEALRAHQCQCANEPLPKRA
jgi:hypothetical protein